MANEDVRVRLSAEGVNDVLAAFRKIESETNKAKKQTSGLAAAFKDLKGLLPTLGVAAAVGGLIAVTKRSIEAADAVGYFASAVGGSAEVISTYAFAAKEAGVEIGSLQKGFKQLAISLGKLKSGDKGATQTFERIGLAAKDFEGLNFDQSLAVVTKRMAELEGGSGKVAIAQELLGSGSLELIEVMDKVGTEGLGPLTQRASDAGAVMSGDLVKAADDAKKAMAAMSQVAANAGNQFLLGFGPSLTEATDKSAAGAKRASEAFRTFGQIIGAVITEIKNLFLGVGELLGYTAASVANTFTGLMSMAKAVPKGLDAVVAARKDMVAGMVAQDQKVKKSLDDLAKQSEEAWKRVGQAPAKGAAGATSGLPKGVDTSAAVPGSRVIKGAADPEASAAAKRQADALAKARLEAAKSAAGNELEVTKASLDAQQAEADSQYTQGLISLGQFYVERKRIIDEALAAEVKSLTAQREAMAKAAPADAAAAVAQKTALADIDAKIAAANFQRDKAYSELRKEVTEEEKQLAEGASRDAKERAKDAEKSLEQLRQTQEQVFGIGSDALSSFFTDGIREADDFNDAIRGMAAGVGQAIQKMVADMLAQKMMAGLFSMIGLPVPAKNGGLMAFASGGFVSGPGTATSDSIPAVLSNGEYVIRAAAVRSLGVDFLNGINGSSNVRKRSVRGYADGGLVSGAVGPQNMNSSMTVGLEPGLVLRELQSPEGTRVLVKALGANRRAVKSAIGG